MFSETVQTFLEFETGTYCSYIFEKQKYSQEHPKLGYSIILGVFLLVESYLKLLHLQLYNQPMMSRTMMKESCWWDAHVQVSLFYFEITLCFNNDFAIFPFLWRQVKDSRWQAVICTFCCPLFHSSQYLNFSKPFSQSKNLKFEFKIVVFSLNRSLCSK